jgi:hypothetical protein
VGAAWAGSVPAGEGRIGFEGMEFYKVDWGTHSLRVADVNGDGLNDILVVNNAKARIECLLQREDPGAPIDPEELEPNELPDDGRFESRPFLSEKQVFSLEVADLNGDGRTDMVYYGDPRELVIVTQNDAGEWGAQRTFDIVDGSRSPYGLVAGDINGDERADIVLLAEDGAYFILQGENGKLKAPVKEAGVPEGVTAVALRDINGDARQDLVYLTFEDTKPLAIRFQGEDGRLGPETRAECASIRAVDFGDPDGDGKDDVLAVKRKSGRLAAYVSQFVAPEDALLDGALERFTLHDPSPQHPPAMALGHFTDTRCTDLVITAAAVNEVELFERSAAGYWSGRRPFPVLESVTDLAAIDADGDGVDELLLLSGEEETIGHAHVDARGRLTFPRALPIAGKPTAMTVARGGEGPDVLIYTTREDGGHSLRLLVPARDEAGETAWSEETVAPVADVRFAPENLHVMDVNQDGRDDILVFLRHEAMRVFKATEDGGYEDVSPKPDYGKGLVQEVKKSHIGAADVDQDGVDELLVARKNFARALRMDAEDRLTVVDQFNGRLPNSAIVGVNGADLDGDGGDEVVLVDAGVGCLSALRKNPTGVYTIVENLPLDDAGLVARLLIRSVTGADRDDLLFLTQSGCYVLQPGSAKLVLNEFAHYETPQRHGRLQDLILGDLDGDGGEEILISEYTKNALEVVDWDPEEAAFGRTLAWPVFEAKTFSGGGGFGRERHGGEPREFRIGDVTRDGKPDIVLLVHDRVLVYPQE